MTSLVSEDHTGGGARDWSGKAKSQDKSCTSSAMVPQLEPPVDPEERCPHRTHIEDISKRGSTCMGAWEEVLFGSELLPGKQTCPIGPRGANCGALCGALEKMDPQKSLGSWTGTEGCSQKMKSVPCGGFLMSGGQGHRVSMSGLSAVSE